MLGLNVARWSALVCSFLVAFTLPALPAAAAIDGTVFRDFDADGARDPGEPGLAGIEVRAYGAGGLVGASPAITGLDGTYSLGSLPAGPLRLEFSVPADGSLDVFQPGAAGPTSVVFSSDGSTVDVGFNNPSQFCEADPLASASCFTSGDPLPMGSAAGALDALVTWPSSRTGDTIPPDHIAFASEVGTIWGLAWSRTRETLYASAFLRRHSGLGPDGMGAIYAIDLSTPAMPVISTALTVANPGLDPRVEGGTTLPTDPNLDSTDPLAYSTTAKRGLGDLEISEDETTLYTINLNTRSLVEIDIDSLTETSSTAITDPGCASADDLRPFGLKVFDGQVYVGVVCSAQSTGNQTDLDAYVLRRDGTGFVTVFGPIDLDPTSYPRSDAFNPGAGNIEWFAWTDTFQTTNAGPGFDGADFNSVYPQPVLSDLEFDSVDGSLILAFSDRQGMQTGNLNLTPDGMLTVQTIAAGDILRVCRDATGAFVLENAGLCEGQGSGTTAGDGPGGGEYYDQDQFSNHKEIALGGLTHRAGTSDIVATIFDPFSFRSAGVRFFDNTDGSLVSGYEVYSTDQTGTQGKAIGLGDVELLCAPAPIELGNRVWCDAPTLMDVPNGIQDPVGATGVADTNLAGVTVSLSCNGGTITATTMTMADGTYLFSDANVVGGIPAGATCTVSIDTTQAALAGCSDPTFANVGDTMDPGQDVRDSDGTDLDLDGTVEVTVVVGGPGANDHELDFGFRIPPAPLLTATKADAILVDGDFDGLLDGGDTLRYTVVLTNTGNLDATGGLFSSSVDSNTSLVVGSVTTTQGTVTTGNTAGDTSVGIDLGTIAMGGGTVTVTYDVVLDDPVAGGVTEVLCQGLVTAGNHPDVSTDDPDPSIGDTDPTATPIGSMPDVSATKVDTLLIDGDFDGVADPGDTIRYTVVISNSGDQDLAAGSFTSAVGAGSTLVVGSVTTTQGSVTSGNTAGDTSVAVDLGTVAGAGGTVTITFDVVVNDPFPDGTASILCQGGVSGTGVSTVQTDDPDDGTSDMDATVTPIETTDFGDAPTGYGTDGAGAASHTIVSGLFLGAGVDNETDGQPTGGADGDDTDAGGDDEDGVTFAGGMAMVSACSTSSLTVTHAAPMGTTAYLDAWLDFNANGMFDDPAEHLNGGAPVELTTSPQVIPFTVPCDAAAQAVSYARFRLTSDMAGVGPTGAADDGEVEDYLVQIKGVDYGDAPASYGTLRADDGPRHTIIAGYSLGGVEDAEADGQPNANADGDDTGGMPDDEDGVAFAGGMAMANACSTGNGLTVTLTDTAGVGVAFLDAWIDFDGNGLFDPAEHLFAGTSAALVAGANALTYDVPCDAAAGTSYARFRLSSAGSLEPTTPVADAPEADGEVEDYLFLLKGLDYGDAPDPTYPTLLASDGARHVVLATGNPTLGTAVDTEPDGQPSATHLGDDQSGSPDDEDGVAFPGGALVPGAMADLVLTGGATGGLVDAWIDFNGDGDWADAGEQVATSLALGAGANLTLPVAVPAGVSAGNTCARFRISSTGGLTPTGLAPDGEVEDYPVAIGVGDPVIGVSKRLVDLTDPGDGTYQLSLEILVANLGNVPLTNVQAEAALATTFDRAGGYMVVSVTSPTLTPNMGFDGDADPFLLVGTDGLGVGESAQILLVVTLDPAGFPGPYNCSTAVSASDPTGGTVTDMSQDGDDPDPDGNGNPGDNDDPTVILVPVDPTEIPTLGTTALVLLTTLLALTALATLRRRKTRA